MHTAPGESDAAIRSDRNGAVAPLLIAATIGSAVSVSFGAYSRVHQPTGEQIAHFGFSSPLSMKAWLGTGVVVLALTQAGTAAWMWGRLPGLGRAPGWAPHLHRWTGTAASLLSLPVAYRRRWSSGYQDTDARVIAHGVLAVGTDGRLIKDAAPAAPGGDPYAPAPVPTEVPAGTEAPAAPAPVTVAPTGLGDALVDSEGLTLYGFTNDADGVPTCEGDCAGAWPPVMVDGAELPDGLDPAVFSVVQRSDGTHQLKAGAWPLYRFAGDANPGETNGQDSGGVWFVVDPTGGLIKDAG
jgi:predicted lipoprotein with Yx(FWY)xxD motif